MVGGCAESSEALAFKPASSGKASKLPNVDGPRRIANHAVVAWLLLDHGQTSADGALGIRFLSRFGFESNK